MRCDKCGNCEYTILGLCAKCDPELHSAYQAALESVTDDSAVTPEMVTAYLMIEQRKEARKDVLHEPGQK